MKNQGKYMKSSSGKRVGSLLIRVALLLLCLVLLSVHLMGGMYAKFVSTGQGEDEARVAKFKVDVVFDDKPVDLNATVDYNQNTGDYTLTVNNSSEVAVAYSVTLYNVCVVAKVDGRERDISLAGVSVQFDEMESLTLSTSTSAFFPNVGTMAPGEHTQTHTLKLAVDWDALLQQIYGQSVSFNITFDICVDVVQVD